MFFNFPGAPGNTGYNAQSNPNPLIAADPSFRIQQKGIRGMSPEDIKMLKDWDPKSADEIDKIYRGIKPGGPQLPLAYSNGSVPMGNAGAIAMGNQGLYNGPQYGQQLPPETVKYVY
jgi:hypothetical protein